MRSMSQGGIPSQIFGTAEYSERTKYRSVSMQHVLPSRNVCVAYHGMTIPLPAPSLCGVFHKPLLTSKAPEGGPKDSGFHSQCTTASDASCNTDSVATSPGGSGLCTGQMKGDDQNEKRGSEIRDVSCDEVKSDLKMSTNGESNAGACWLSKCSKTRSPICLSPGEVVENPVSGQVWAGTGRGRALQQFMSQSPTFGCGPGKAKMNIGVSAAHSSDTTAQTDLRQSFSEDAELDDKIASFNAKQLSVAGEGMCGVHLSCGTSATGSSSVGPQTNENNDSVNGENESGAVPDTKYASPVELVGESNNTTESVDVSVKSDVYHPETQKDQITCLVNESRAQELQPLSPELTNHSDSAASTPSRSSRKSKVSLAIQFKGACSVTQRDATPPLCPPECEGTPQSVVLLKPSDFTLQSSSARFKKLSEAVRGEAAVKAEEVTADVELGRKALLVDTESETSDCAQDSVKDIEKERVCKGSLEEIPPLVSDVEDYDQHHMCLLSKSDVEVDSPEAKGEETLGPLQHQHLYLSPVRSLSSDEDMVECAEARMGRSADEMEKSIALHQRNIHRNRMELRRVQRKNKATEEMLAGDLADQCHEDLSRDSSLQYSTTEERESKMGRVVDLQLQFSIHSEAVKKRAADYVAILEQGNTAYKNDKLASIELQLEVEAMEVEDQLMLDKMKSQLLQAKSELIYD